MKKNVIVGTLITAAVCAVAVVVMKKAGKKYSGSSDSYPDVEDEGDFTDPDIESEFDED